VLVGTDEGAVTLWRRGRDPATLTLAGHATGVIPAARGRDTAYTLSQDGIAQLWSITSGMPIATLRHNDVAISRLIISPDGHRVVTLPRLPNQENGPPLHARLWDGETGAAVAELPTSLSPTDAQFDRSGELLVTSGKGAVAQLWDPRTGTLRGSLNARGAISGATFAGAGYKLVLRSGATMLLWRDATAADEPQVLNDPTGNIRDLALSADGALAVTGDDGGIVRLWNLETGEALRQFEAGFGAPVKVAISLDGNRVAAVAKTGLAAIWPAGPLGLASAPDWQLLIDLAEATAGPNLTQSERRRYFLPAAPGATKSMAPASGNDGGATECDRLAAHPSDPDRRASGVPFDAIEIDKALAACAPPSGLVDPRQNYQFARVLDAAHRENEAVARFRAAAEAGYPWAMYFWSEVLASGQLGVARDADASREWLLRAAKAGLPTAEADLGVTNWQAAGNDAAKKAAAMAMINAAAAAGDGIGNYDLAAIEENAGQRQPATVHYLIAREKALGEEKPAIVAASTSRLQFLLRQIPFGEALKIVAEARR
jgi:hypothetical protein